MIFHTALQPKTILTMDFAFVSEESRRIQGCCYFRSMGLGSKMRLYEGALSTRGLCPQTTEFT